MHFQFIHVFVIFLIYSTRYASNAQNDDVVFGSTIQVVDPVSKESIALDVSLTKRADPFALASDLKAKYKLNLVTYRWLLRSFQHSQKRLGEDEVQRLHINGTNESKMPPLIVRFGDDLANLSRIYAHKTGMTFDAANEVYQDLIKNVPEHSSLEWVKRRRSHTTLSPLYSNSSSTSTLESNDTMRTCELTVAIATSGNPDFFYNFVESFPNSDLVCQVIIVDDLSSREARIKMLTTYPQFTFVFKALHETGSVETLNTIVRLSSSRFLLYMSDAWNPVSADDYHLRQALAILKGDATKTVAQIVLNDMSSVSCSLGLNVASCSGQGGWKRIMEWQGHMVEYNENE